MAAERVAQAIDHPRLDMHIHVRHITASCLVVQYINGYLQICEPMLVVQ